MTDIHIPLDFANPTNSDFVQFSDVIDRLTDKQIHVHCIYNAWVTGFFYRHALTSRGALETPAYLLMDGIWRLQATTKGDRDLQIDHSADWVRFVIMLHSSQRESRP